MAVKGIVTQCCHSVMKVVRVLLEACGGSGGGGRGCDGGGLRCARGVTHRHGSGWPSTLTINCEVDAYVSLSVICNLF